MHQVTTENMNAILGVIKSDLSEQKRIFEALALNPYDNDFDANPLMSQPILFKKDVDYDLKEIIELFGDGYVSEEREEELRVGGKLTNEELQELYELVIQRELDSESVNYLVVAQIQSPQQKSIYALYSEAMLGQGGIHIMNFFGFFEDAESAENSLQTLEGVILP